jgi:peptidoglycan/LPS O-acetylase OafA/YrhL
MDNEQLQRLRFDFLHGLRGVLSLTVVLYHLVAGLGIDRSRPAVALLLTPIMHGHLAVPAFLVLSGFLLAMPVVLRGGQLPGGDSISFAAARFAFCRRTSRPTSCRWSSFWRSSGGLISMGSIRGAS